MKTSDNRIPYAAATQAYSELVRTPPRGGPAAAGHVSVPGYENLETNLIRLLYEVGYPQPMSPEKAPVDQRIAVLVHKELAISPAEASDIGYWRHLNCKVFPWLVWWRWSRKDTLPNPERFLSATRNYLGNLWWRAELFSVTGADGTPAIVSGLQEDDFIGLIERPGIRGYREAIRALALGIARYRGKHSGEHANEVIRKAVIGFRVYAAAHELLALEQRDIEALVESLLERREVIPL